LGIKFNLKEPYNELPCWGRCCLRKVVQSTLHKEILQSEGKLCWILRKVLLKGKAMDFKWQTASLNGFDIKITGVTNDYSKTAGSHVC